MAKKNESAAVVEENLPVNGAADPAPDDDFDDDDDDFGDEVESGTPASETVAALSAAVPAESRRIARASDGKRTLSVRLDAESLKRIRVRALVDGVKPAEIVEKLIKTHIKELVITER